MISNSLTTRLVLLLTLTIAITLTGVTAVDYLTSRTRILREQEGKVEATVEATVRNLEVRLSVLEKSTELLAEVIQGGDYSEPDLRALLWEAVDGRDDLFGAALALNPSFTRDPTQGFAAYYYYRDGELAYSDLSQAYDYVLSAWYREPLSSGHPLWTEPYYDAGGGDVDMVTYAVPMYRQVGGERTFYGVVTADIPLQKLQYYLERMDLGERGFGFMLSRSGKIMASPDPEDWLKPWTSTLTGPEQATLWGNLLGQVAPGKITSAKVPCFDLADDCIVELAPLAKTQWPVGAYYSEYEILAPLRDYLTKSVLSQLLTLTLLLIGITWVSRRITRPLRSLAMATADIATGNFHTPLPASRSSDELGRLVHAFSIMQDNLQRFVDELQAETASRNRLEGELNAATAIQMSMLPSGGQAHVIEDQFKLWARLRPAKSVGGDLYTFYLQRRKKLFVAVGDVSDKGVPAALFMARAMTLLQQYTYSTLDAGAIMAQLNDELVEGNDNCMFVTLCLGWLDLESLVFAYASGGHTPPALLRDGQALFVAQEDGPALGLMEDQPFPLNQLQLQPGDLLGLFTDGIEEAFDNRGQQFGLGAITEILRETAGQSLEAVGQAILGGVDTHQGDVPQSDDITLMLLQPRNPGSDRSRITLENDAGAVSTLQAWLGQLMSEAELSRDLRAEMQLVAEEVVTNVFKYGQLETGNGAEVTLAITDECLVMEFRDRGVAFDPLAEAQRSNLGRDTESATIGGLGVHLLEALTDEQHYQRDGQENRLRLVKHLNHQQRGRQ